MDFLFVVTFNYDFVTKLYQFQFAMVSCTLRAEVYISFSFELTKNKKGFFVWQGSHVHQLFEMLWPF